MTTDNFISRLVVIRRARQEKIRLMKLYLLFFFFGRDVRRRSCPFFKVRLDALYMHITHFLQYNPVLYGFYVLLIWENEKTWGYRLRREERVLEAFFSHDRIFWTSVKFRRISEHHNNRLNFNERRHEYSKSFEIRRIAGVRVILRPPDKTNCIIRPWMDKPMHSTRI